MAEMYRFYTHLLGVPDVSDVFLIKRMLQGRTEGWKYRRERMESRNGDKKWREGVERRSGG
jgi:hypothetical protein